jgi:hypothetical protein
MERHKFTPEPEEPETIGGYKVLETTQNPDGTVTKRLQDGYVDTGDPDETKNAIDRAKELIAMEKRARRAADGKSLSLPIAAMRQPARPKTSASEADGI